MENFIKKFMNDSDNKIDSKKLYCYSMTMKITIDIF